MNEIFWIHVLIKQKAQHIRNRLEKGDDSYEINIKHKKRMFQKDTKKTLWLFGILIGMVLKYEAEMWECRKRRGIERVKKK